MNSEDPLQPTSEIAIIGFAGRFPGAENAKKFWENLRGGVESIRPLSNEELRFIGVGEKQLNDPDYVKAGAPLAHVDSFDAAFFGISPKDAAIMDPQQRHFLECAWTALEHAGYAPGALPGPAGVFGGSGPNSYLIYNLLSDRELVEQEGIFLLRHMGNDKDVLATRVSYQMNLRGPSLNIQTACSTSLVAVHVACQSLLNHECDLALAGAVSFEIPHATGYVYRKSEIQSQDGHCRAFDAKATGTVFGSGLGIVVLRRLSDALAAGDTIHAVIKGSAINNDGTRKVGFLAPSAEAQVDVISEALAVADVDPASIDYIEAHGTGTLIGDPIELSALGQVFRDRDRKLQVGSVKTNIGHLDTAAGMAGLIKVVQALRYREIPPTLHFQTPNPLIDFDKAQLQVADQLVPWEKDEGPRRAGVTSLGIGGTNAHLVLEEAPASMPSHAARPQCLLTLSAKSAAALDASAADLTNHLRENPELNLDDAAYTLHVGRAEFNHRRMVVGRNREDILSLLATPQPPSKRAAIGEAKSQRSIAFLFSGQGTQHVNMGGQLYRTEPVFRRWIDQCAKLAEPHLGFDFRGILYPPPEKVAEAAELIEQTWNAQPILFAFEYALSQLWMSWGIRPAMLLGHSLGEYVAACLSDIFTLEDAVALVCARGNLMRKVDKGAMLAVGLGEADVATWLNGTLALAAVNAPEQCVISGAVAEIDRLEKNLTAQGIGSHRLHTSHAFHSSLLDPVMELFAEIVKRTPRKEPRIPIISNPTGKQLTKEEAIDPSYWVRHLRQTVQFNRGLEELLAVPSMILLEIGSGETLASLSRHHVKRVLHQLVIPSLPRSKAHDDDAAGMLAALGNLWVNGVSVAWKDFHAQEKLHRIPLPTYPFEKNRFWMGPNNGSDRGLATARQVDDWFYRPVWKRSDASASSDAAAPILLFTDATEESRQLTASLRRQGANVVTVVPGAKFSVHDLNSLSINGSSEKDYQALLDYLVGQKALPRHIVYLWALKPEGAPMEKCFFGLLWLIQALGKREPDRSFVLTAFSCRAESVQGEAVLNPWGALVEGPCRVAPQEHSSLSCRHIDLDSIDAENTSKIILNESAGERANGTVAYRNGIRWMQDIERVSLHPQADVLRKQGVYVITGGLGGLGMKIADWLATAYQARLVLISRDGERQKIKYQDRFDRWEKSGADILVCSADVTSKESMATALKQAREKFGAPAGIFHAAGILHDGIIQLKKRESAAEVLSPKVTGVQVLCDLLRDQPLDFFVLFSSVSALVPPPGQIDYCSANGYLNAFAQTDSENKMLAIGWGPWAEIGMAASARDINAIASPIDHPLLRRLESDSASGIVYSGSLSVERDWILGEHRFHGGDSLLPGTGHLEIAVTAIWKKNGKQPIVLHDIVFLAPMKVAPGTPIDFRAELRQHSSGYQFSVSSHGEVFVSGQCESLSALAPRIDCEKIADRCQAMKIITPVNLRQNGHFDFGPRWGSMRQILLGESECLATLELPPKFAGETDRFSLHPALMDMATGSAMFLIPGYDKPGDLLLPFAYKRMTVYDSLPRRLVSHARIRENRGTDLAVFDLTLATETGEVLVEIEEFTVKRLRDASQISAHVSRPDSSVVATNYSTGFRPDQIRPAEGVEALHKLLNARATGVVYVSPTALSATPDIARNDADTLSEQSADSDVERALGQLWRRLLGLQKVDAGTDFFDSGGHSLVAVRLFAEIRKRFHVDLGLSTLFEARTMGALADLIKKNRQPEGSKKARVLANDLVAVRSQGSKTPLFLIHDVGGTVMRYEHLARNFPEDQPIYAIESRALKGLPADHHIEEMAAHYIQYIRKQQPEGPYFVAGHSFGGLVTYEIARQLAAQKQVMGLVGLIDTYHQGWPGVEAVPRPQVTGHLPLPARLAYDIRKIIGGTNRKAFLQERKVFIRDRIVKTSYRALYGIYSRLNLQVPASLSNAKEANWIASDRYMPKPYDGEGKIVFFRCLNPLPTDPPDSFVVWNALTNGRVEICEVPGDHNSMLREPNVRIMAGQFMRFLNSVDAAAREPA